MPSCLHRFLQLDCRMRLGKVVILLGLASGFGFAEPSKRVVGFEVDDVELADSPLADKSARDVMMLSAGDPVEAHSEVAGQWWITNSISSGHPFLVAVHQAYVDHRPLVLTPDVIWTLLIQMAAKEVNENPDDYRGLFNAQEKGVETIAVRRDEFRLGDPANDWGSVFSEMEARVLGKGMGGVTGRFAHAFSSSRESEIAARRVVLLGAASPFFDYRVATLCGIPRIELVGEVDDWEWIRANTPSLEVFNMKKRVKALLPVLDEFVTASRGKAQRDFWQRIYHVSHECRGEEGRGWFSLFLIDENHRNLDEALKEGFSWASVPFTGREMYTAKSPGSLNLSRFTQTGMTMVDFHWQYFDTTIPMRWRAGFLGVAQDRRTLALRPVIGWQVLRAKLTKDEREFANFVERLTLLSFTPCMAVANAFRFNHETGLIERDRSGEELPEGEGRGKDFWKAAFKMMVSVEEIRLPSWRYAEPLMSPEDVVEVLQTAPRLKVVHVNEKTGEEMLQRLKEVPGWEIRMKK